jgi:hypothetical protein
MKFYFKSWFLAGLLASTLSTASYSLEALMAGAGEQADDTVTSMLLSQVLLADEETTHPVFKEGVTWSQPYRTADGQELKLSFTYNPLDKNDMYMPQLLLTETTHGSVVQHFMEELSRKINPSIPIQFPEGSSEYDKKIGFITSIEKTPWIESVLKLPDFDITKLYNAYLAEQEAKKQWEKALYEHLNTKPLEALSLTYSVPVNSGFLKKYFRTDIGPIIFRASEEKLEQVSSGKGGVKGKGSKTTHDTNSNYDTNLNYGTFTLSIIKGASDGSVKSQVMPADLPKLIEAFDGSMKCTLGVLQSYAQHSYGHRKDNSRGMIV